MNAYRKIPNINILPEEYHRTSLTLLQVCLILIIVVAAVMGGLVYSNRSDALDEKASLKQQLEDYQITQAMNQRVTQGDQLRTSIASLNEELIALQKAITQLEGLQVNWTEFFSTLLSTSAPAIDDITQSQLKITINGTATGTDQLQQYRNSLLDLGSVTDVQIPTVNQSGANYIFKMVITVKGA